MPECSGQIVIEATEQVFKVFEQDRNQGLEALVALAQADPGINDECDVFFETLQIKGDSACFEFDDDYWLETAKRLAASGRHIGLYLRSLDEYGGQFFLAHNRQGESFSFFAGGPDDDFETEGGDLASEDDLNQWLALIPESLQAAFPELVEMLD